MQSNVIIYSLFSIVAVMVLIFGYKAITTLSEKSEEGKAVLLQTELKKDISSLTYRYGSVDIKNYEFPLNIGEICFIDLEINKKDKISSGLRSRFPIIANQIESETKNNLFMFDSSGDYINALAVGDLKVKGPGWVCYENKNGKFTLELEGKGNATEIKKEFSDKKRLTTTGVTLEVDGIPGLKAFLKANNNVDAYVKLRVEGDYSDALTDNIYLDTLDLSSNDYPNAINFHYDSYIQIPVSDCSNAGDWAGIPKRICSNNLATYDIRMI